MDMETVRDKLSDCEECGGKKTTYLKGEWLCKECDSKVKVHSSAEFVLRGEGWPSKSVRKHKPERRKY